MPSSLYATSDIILQLYVEGSILDLATYLSALSFNSNCASATSPISVIFMEFQPDKM